MKIKGVEIGNIETYRRLRQIFDGKNPSQQTVLIFKLLYEGKINLEEAELLSNNSNKPLNDQKGGGFGLLQMF